MMANDRIVADNELLPPVAAKGAATDRIVGDLKELWPPSTKHRSVGDQNKLLTITAKDQGSRIDLLANCWPAGQ